MFRAIIVLVCLFRETFAAAQNHESQVLFDPTKDKATIGFHSFRIPSIVRGKTSGVLIAIAEARFDKLICFFFKKKSNFLTIILQQTMWCL